MTITLLDGGMGQELVARSSEPAHPLWSAMVMHKEPQLVLDVHTEYFSAGAEIATTNSYILNRDRLTQGGAEELFEPLNIKACELASRARDRHGSGLIAGSMGPTGKSYRPDLAMELEQGAEAYSEIARVQAPFVDFFLLETMASVKQAEGAVMGAASEGKPIWLSVTVNDENGQLLRSGEPIKEILELTQRYPIEALLVNCSVPEAIVSAVNELSASLVPFGAYANGFTKISDAFKELGTTVDELSARQDLNPEKYAEFAQHWVDSGATLIGGCCEVGPAHIQTLHQTFKA